MQNDSLVKMKDQLEYLFLRIIVSGLKSNTLPVADAKRLAQEFLRIEPFVSIEDAHTKINGFTTTHNGFGLLKEYSDVYYDEDRLDEKLDIMRTHIKNNNIDEALAMVHTQP